MHENRFDTLPEGKDAPFETTIDTLRARLLDLGVDVEERAFLNPTEGVWSVNLAMAGCPGLFTNGKGTSRDAALASAYGELFERLTTGYLFSDLYLPLREEDGFGYEPREVWLEDLESAKLEALTPELWEFYDPEDETEEVHLLDFNTGGERGICALPFVDEAGAQVLFPVAILENLYVSNGMAAGNTFLEARVQALSEVLERYVKNKIIADGLCLPDVPEEVLAEYPLVVDGIAEMEKSGLRITVKDASLGGRFPVMCVVAANTNDGGVFAAFGAHPRFGVALFRTFTEMFQGRSELSGFPFPSMDADLVASPGNLEEHFVDSAGLLHWDFFKGTPDHAFVRWGVGRGVSREEEYAMLAEAVHGEEGVIYSWESEHLGMPCCRLVVPGMSEIYPVEDFIWENRGRQVRFREGLLALSSWDRASAEAFFELAEDGAFAPETLVCEVAGIAGTNPWQDVAVAEVAAWAAFKAEAFEDAARWFGVAGRLEVPMTRKLYHQAMEAMLMASSEGEVSPDISRVLPGAVVKAVVETLENGAFLPISKVSFGALLTLGEHGHIAERVGRFRK